MVTKDAHFYDPGPKHILALDGGGVRGVLTLAFLERIEDLLAEHYGGADGFYLSDHFALIGGTSTGSIIASALALGHRVSDILDVYLTLAHQAFGKRRWFGGLIAPKFAEGPLIECIRSRVGDVTLGSDDLRTGLGIVAKRLDTNSVWLFHNHPRGPYFENSSPDVTYTANRNLGLLNIIRASTAAPTYFEPEFISIAPGVEGTFVDGGVSPHNNPSLALFMLATIHGYGFRWPMGAGNLHLMSVGTGRVTPHLEDAVVRGTTAASIGISSVRSMMSDCEQFVETMMQWMSVCHTPTSVDSEIGDLSNDRMGAAATCQYTRFNIHLERDWIREHLGHDIDRKQLARLSKMDEPSAISDLIALGREAALNQVRLDRLLIRT